MNDFTDTGELFAVLHKKGAAQLEEDVRDGHLSYKHIAVFVAIVRRLDFRTGMAAVTAEDIASGLGMNPAMCRSCISQLQKRMLLARGYASDKGVRYMPNPYVASCGALSRRTFFWKQFCHIVETGSASLPEA